MIHSIDDDNDDDSESDDYDNEEDAIALLGYVQLNDGFEIDEWLQIKLQFKTTSQDGVILAMGNVGK